MTAEELIQALAAKIQAGEGWKTEIKIKQTDKGYSARLKQGRETVTVEETADLIETLKQLIGA